MWQGHRVTVSVTHKAVTYTLRDGPNGELKIRHAGEDLTLSTTEPTTVPLQDREPLLPRPPQPPGREPMHRRSGLVAKVPVSLQS
jgi:hypothetical protein